MASIVLQPPKRILRSKTLSKKRQELGNDKSLHIVSEQKKKPGKNFYRIDTIEREPG